MFLETNGIGNNCAHEKVCKTTEHQDMPLHCPNCRQSLYEETAKYIPRRLKVKENRIMLWRHHQVQDYSQKKNLRIHNKKIKDDETKRMNYKYVELNKRVDGIIKKLEVLRRC